MKYKQIIFDIDGTLIDTEDAVMQSMQDTILEMTGKFYEIEDLTFAFGITGEDALKRLGLAPVDTIVKRWEERFQHYKERMVVFEGMEDVLEKLIAKGYELGVVTSKNGKECEEDFFTYPISKYFKTIVCADDTKEHKPNPEPLLKYMELTGCKAEELIYIGDSEYDMKCARGAGMDHALAKWGAKKDREATYILEKAEEILEVV